MTILKLTATIPINRIPQTSQDLIPELINLIDTIEINGVIHWSQRDRVVDVPASTDSADLLELELAGSLKTQPFSPPSSAQRERNITTSETPSVLLAESALQKFNVALKDFYLPSQQSVNHLNAELCNLIWAQIAMQLKPLNSSVQFPSTLPMNQATLIRLKRRGEVFSYELYCAVPILAGKTIYLGIIATLDLNPRLEDSAQQDIISCELMLESIDFSLSSRIESNAIFSTISSNLTNPIGPPSSSADFYALPENLLQEVDVEIGTCIAKLSEKAFLNETQVDVLLYPFIRLFHATLKKSAIELRSSASMPDLRVGIPKQLSLLVADLLQNNISLRKLLEYMKNTLFQISSSERILSSQKLATILQLLHNPIVTNSLESARFISKTPSSCLTNQSPFEENSIACYAYIIQLSIEIIRESLQTVANHKHFISQGLKNPNLIENADHVSSAFSVYLLNSAQHSIIPNAFIDAPDLTSSMDTSLASNPLIMGAFLSGISSGLQPDFSIKINPEQILNDHVNQQVEIFTISSSPPTRKIECCPDSLSQEKRAALWKSNPIILALNYGPALYLSVDQVLQLSPEARMNALPYLAIVEWAGDIFGFWIGRDSILYPNIRETYFEGIFARMNDASDDTSHPEKAKRTHPLARMIETLTKSSVVLVCTLNTVINIYKINHPNVQRISDQKFWQWNLALGPLILTCGYGVWNFISPESKRHYFPEHSLKRHLKTGLDLLADTLSHTGTFDLFLLKFFHLLSIEENPLYYLAPIIPGFLLALGKNFSSYAERISNVMTHLSAATFTWLLAEELSHQLKAHNPTWPSLRIAFISAQVIVSMLFTLKNSSKFLQVYKPPQLIARIANNPDYANRHSNGQPITFSTQQLRPLLDITTADTSSPVQDERGKTLLLYQQRLEAQRQSENPYRQMPDVESQSFSRKAPCLIL